jgi:hypothetical protein
MNLDQAKDVARDEATKQNKPYVVVRMPAWREGEYIVFPADRGFPPGIEITHTIQPPKTGLLF